MADFEHLSERLRTLIVWDDAAPALWFAKLVGAVSGSLISIAYILPKGRREAVLRFAVGLVTGLVFGGPAGIKTADFLGLLEKISATEVALMGASLVSLSAWWALGVLQRLAEHWNVGQAIFSKFNSARKDREE